MLVEGDAASGLGSKTRPRRGGPPPASAADRCRRRHCQWLHVSKRQRRRQSTASGRCGGARLGTAVICAAMSARHSARDDRARRRAPPAAASSPHAGEAQTPFSGRSDASELGAPEELEEGYAPGCLATPRSLLATVDFSLGARRIAVAAAAASARYSLVTADEPYMTRRRMARRAVSHETGSMGYDTWDTREMRAP